MYDLARSCQELQEKFQFFSTKKTHKKWHPRILPRNPGKHKNKREKAGGVKIPGYNLAHRQATRTIKIQESHMLKSGSI